MIFYPLKAILLFLSLLFAPTDTRRIDIRCEEYSAIVVRGETGWMLEGLESGAIAIDGTRFIDKAGVEPQSIDLKAFVSEAMGHDPESEPKLAFKSGDGTIGYVIESTPDGFSVTSEHGPEETYQATVSYIRPGLPVGPGCNVLGAVKQPGIIAFVPGDTLRSVLLKAGGPAEENAAPTVWLLSGNPGESISRREEFNLVRVLEGRHENVRIADRDIIYIKTAP